MVMVVRAGPAAAGGLNMMCRSSRLLRVYCGGSIDREQ